MAIQDQDGPRDRRHQSENEDRQQQQELSLVVARKPQIVRAEHVLRTTYVAYADGPNPSIGPSGEPRSYRIPATSVSGATTPQERCRAHEAGSRPSE